MSAWPSKWAGKTWTTSDGDFSEHRLRLMLSAVPDSRAMWAAVVGTTASDRRVDRAMQLLRHAGLIVYVDRQWRRTDDGDAVVSR